MNNLKTLLKISFINLSGINSLSKGVSSSKEKRKLLFTASMFGFMGVLILFMSGLYSFGLSEALVKIGQLELLLIFAAIVSAILTIITQLYNAQGILFSSKDCELLAALPLKSSTILSSKLIEMMIINYIFTALVFVPASVVFYIRSTNVSWTFFIMMIIGLIFMPMIPIVIASIIAVLVSFISSRSKHRSLTAIIAGTVATLGVLYASIRSGDIINYFVAHSTSIKEGFVKAYPPAGFLTNAIVNFDLVSMIKYIAISLIPFIIFIVVFSKTFNKINMLLNETFRKSNYKMGELKTESPIKSLIDQELKKYFSIPIYVMNTAIGMVIILGASILTLFKGKEILAQIAQIDQIRNMADSSNMLAGVALIVLIFGIGLSCTTVCSISLEGKNLWIKKTLPISEADIFKSKIVTNLIITVPLSIVTNIIFFFALKFEFIYLLLNIAVSIMFAVLNAVLGLIINLYLPKMEWTTPTAVVKQSAAVLVSILLVFGIIVLSIAAVVFFQIENIKLVLLSALAINIILTAISWKVLNTKGVQLFKAL